jgi:hypothetical protein
MFPKNVEKIKNLPQPKNIKTLQRFLGMINYYRRFIKGLSYLTEPMLVNLRQPKWIWDKPQIEAYNKIIRKFLEEPILIMPDFNLPFIVKTDASENGYGAVLCQEIKGVEHPIAFSSGTFSSEQRKYSTWEKEALSVVLAVKKYHHFLVHQKFKIVTDNQINTYLLKPEKPLANQRQIRWQLFLKNYIYSIEHRPGKFLYLEDGLSRSFINAFITNDTFTAEQAKDPFIINIIKLINNELVDDKIAEAIYNNNKDNFIIDNNILYYLDRKSKQQGNDSRRIVIPVSLESEVMFNAHNLPVGGHLGYLKTFSRLQLQVWFPNMFSKVKKYCEHCEICDRNRNYFKINDTLKPVTATEPFQVLVVDHCGPFNKTNRGNKYVLTVVDHFTRKRWFLPVPEVSAEETYKTLLQNIFTPFGFPKILLSDKGSCFTSKIGTDFSKLFHYEISLALTNQHNTVGSAEISNKLVENIIRKYIDNLKQDDWDEFLCLAAYALNQSISVHGYSPDYLVFGKNETNPYLPTEGNNPNIEQFVSDRKEAMDLALKLSNDKLLEYRKKIEEKFVNTKRRFTKFSIGNWVYLKKPLDSVQSGLSHKLDSQSLGPFKIIEINDAKANVTLQLAPNYIMEVKNNLVRLSKNQNILVDPNELRPTTLKEIIILKSISEIEKLKKLEKPNKNKNKKQLKIPEELVGKRIEVLWKTGRYKGWHPATVIGYNANKAKSLVFYDKRDKKADPTTDYYAHDLRPDSKEEWRFL